MEGKKSSKLFSVYKCTSKLGETFKKKFKDKYNFIGEREIRFELNDPIYKEELIKIIKTTLTYHNVKKLDNLGLE